MTGPASRAVLKRPSRGSRAAARKEQSMPKPTRIYTRTGDEGTTGLVGGARIKKSAPRIETYGTVDELSSAIGVARAALRCHLSNESARATSRRLARVDARCALQSRQRARDASGRSRNAGIGRARRRRRRRPRTRHRRGASAIFRRWRISSIPAARCRARSCTSLARSAAAPNAFSVALTRARATRVTRSAALSQSSLRRALRVGALDQRRRSASRASLESGEQAARAGLAGPLRSDARMSFLSELFATTDAEKLRELGKRKILRRALTAKDFVAIGLGTMIGGGIFTTIGTGVKGAGPAVIISYLLAGLTSFFAALCYAELGAMVPVAGSAYTYAYATHGQTLRLDHRFRADLRVRHQRRAGRAAVLGRDSRRLQERRPGAARLGAAVEPHRPRRVVAARRAGTSRTRSTTSSPRSSSSG